MIKKLTVLMAVYNGEKYLKTAIESILCQDFKDFDFIIIDDGSLDNTHSIINQFNDSRIKYFKNKKNIGLSASLNYGIELASSEFIARMDADDISLPNRLSKQIKFLEDHDEYGLVGSWIQELDSKKIYKYPSNNFAIKNTFLSQNCIAHPTVMFRKSEMIKYGLQYDTEFKYAQDYDLWIRCQKHFKIGNIEEVLLLYRTHENQMQNTFKEYVYSEPALIKVKQLSNFIKSDLYDNKNLIMCYEILKGEYFFTLDAFIKIDNFFYSMLYKNSIIHTYDQAFFEESLFQIWFSAFIKIKNYNPKLLHKITKLYFFKKLTAKQKIYFYIKCIIYIEK
jgi:glycosyltransferase involved in cell wall biosynthesis